MSDGTSIEWTEATWNPIRARLLANPARIGWHCEHVSPGCVNCYAETMNRAGRSQLTGTRLPYKPGHRKDVEVFVAEKALRVPLSWRRGRKVFVCSMTDLFGEFVEDAMIDQVFAVMALARHHTFQVLTKRPDRMREYLTASAPIPVASRIMCETFAIVGVEKGLAEVEWPLPNVWLGVSVEDQQRADERIPLLLDTPAAKRWLSCEPLLGPVNLQSVKAPRYPDEPKDDLDIDWRFDALTTGDYYWFDGEDGQPGDCSDGPMRDARIDWVVAGGESGPGARPMHPDWARGLRDQCASATLHGDDAPVPFLFKQWGAWAPSSDEALGGMQHVHLFDDGQRVGRFGKKAAGRVLDGQLHDGYPA